MKKRTVRVGAFTFDFKKRIMTYVGDHNIDAQGMKAKLYEAIEEGKRLGIYLPITPQEESEEVMPAEYIATDGEITAEYYPARELDGKRVTNAHIKILPGRTHKLNLDFNGVISGPSSSVLDLNGHKWVINGDVQMPRPAGAGLPRHAVSFAVIDSTTGEAPEITTTQAGTTIEAMRDLGQKMQEAWGSDRRYTAASASVNAPPNKVVKLIDRLANRAVRVADLSADAIRSEVIEKVWGPLTIGSPAEIMLDELLERFGEDHGLLEERKAHDLVIDKLQTAEQQVSNLRQEISRRKGIDVGYQAHTNALQVEIRRLQAIETKLKTKIKGMQKRRRAKRSK